MMSLVRMLGFLDRLLYYYLRLRLAATSLGIFTLTSAAWRTVLDFLHTLAKKCIG